MSDVSGVEVHESSGHIQSTAVELAVPLEGHSILPLLHQVGLEVPLRTVLQHDHDGGPVHAHTEQGEDVGVLEQSGEGGGGGRVLLLVKQGRATHFIASTGRMKAAFSCLVAPSFNCCREHETQDNIKYLETDGTFSVAPSFNFYGQHIVYIWKLSVLIHRLVLGTRYVSHLRDVSSHLDHDGGLLLSHHQLPGLGSEDLAKLRHAYLPHQLQLSHGEGHWDVGRCCCCSYNGHPSTGSVVTMYANVYIETLYNGDA